DPKEGASCTPLSYNAYIYAFDDPVNRIDPTGRGEATIEQGQLIGIGLLASAGIIAFQKQIACDFGIAASLVTGVAASQNLFYVKSVRFHPDTCSAEVTVDPDCEPILRHAQMEVVKGRYFDMMTDPWDLYNKAYDTPNLGT